MLWFSWILTGGVILLIIGVLALIIWMLVEYSQLPAQTDVAKTLIGELGVVKAECTPHHKGKVYVAGAYWDAISEYGVLHVGKDVRVVDVKERFLVVRGVDLVSSEVGGQRES